MSSRHSGRKKRNTLEAEKQRLSERVQELYDEKQDIIQWLNEIVEEANAKVQLALRETSKKKFMVMHADVSQTLDRCWRKIFTLKTNIKDLNEISSDESESDGSASLASISTITSYSLSEAMGVHPSSSLLKSSANTFVPREVLHHENQPLISNNPPLNLENKYESAASFYTEINTESFDRSDDSIIVKDTRHSEIINNCDERLLKSVDKDNVFMMTVRDNKCDADLQILTDNTTTSELCTNFNFEVSSRHLNMIPDDPIIIPKEHNTLRENVFNKSVCISGSIKSNQSPTNKILDSVRMNLNEEQSCECVCDAEKIKDMENEKTPDYNLQVEKVAEEDVMKLEQNITDISDLGFVSHEDDSKDPVTRKENCDTTSKLESSFSSVSEDNHFSANNGLMNQNLHNQDEPFSDNASITSSIHSVNLHESSDDYFDIPMINMKKGDFIQGIVLAVHSPSRFWLQVDDEKMKSDRLLEALSKFCKTARSLTSEELHEGQYGCAWYQRDESWNRVQIKKIICNKENVPYLAEVFFVDYGNREEIPIHHLKTLHKRFMKYPALAICCCLGEVQPNNGKEWSQLSIETFKELIYSQIIDASILEVHEEFVVVKATQENIEKDGFKSAEIINIAEFLVSHQLAKPLEVYISDGEEDVAKDKKCSIENTKVPISPAQEENLINLNTASYIEKDNKRFILNAVISDKPVEDMKKFNLMISFIESPTSFYVNIVETQATKMYNFVHNEMNMTYKENDELQCPSSKDVVANSCWAAKYSDRNWYRVRVIRLQKNNSTHRRKKNSIESQNSNNKVLVQYIDFGNRELLSVSQLRPLLECLCEIPALAIHASLYDIVPFELSKEQLSESPDTWHWSKEATNFFYSLINDKEMYSAEVNNIREDSIWKKHRLLQLTLHINDRMIINDELVKNKIAMSTLFGNSLHNQENNRESSLPNDWNPMAEDFHSALNSYSIDEDDLGVATCGHSETSMDRRTVYSKCDPLELPKVGTRVIVSVSAIFNPGHFYVVFPKGTQPIDEVDLEDVSEETENLLNLMKAMEKSYEQQLPERNVNIFPTEGEIVAGVSAKVWSRLRVLQVDFDNGDVEVCSVDFGHCEWLPLKDIYPLKPEFSYLPYQAVECFMANVEPIGRKDGLSWSGQSRAWFDSMVNDTMLVAHIIDSDEFNLYVHLYDDPDSESFNEQLVKKGFAKWVRNKETLKAEAGHNYSNDRILPD